ncbi:MAG TPA: glycosyltransferase family 39 protein [Chthoniobacterales bacterium]|nr:glycosyltransferase family 39 protein [Chthoniobacterales bacterium]
MICLWAALYLPLLGLSELRGEEGKRVMPALQMLESGNYLVPYLGARPYFNKPPLINWIVAASFRVSGVRNEWTARLPSAISVLVVALVLVTIGRNSLGSAGSTIAAVSWLTMLEVISKGRTIDTDAISAAFFALALIFWLTFWQRDRSPWLIFTVPWIFLGLGFLTKGPGLLLFFYSIVIAVAWRTGRLRKLLHPAHWLGIALMLSIFAAWAVPFFRALGSESFGQIWRHELSAILFGEKGRSEHWALNFPRGIAYFLPWILLLPFIRFQKIDNPIEREIARGLFMGSVVPFVVVLFFPGSVPRYVLPLAAPLSWIVGIAAAHNAFEWRLKNFRFSPAVAKWTIAIAILGAIVAFPIRTALDAKGHQVLKPTAAQINALMPAGEPLYAVDLGYAPYLFYVRSPLHYPSTLEQLPADAHFLLIQSRDLPRMESNARWNAVQPKFLARTTFFRSHDMMLFRVNPSQPNP